MCARENPDSKMRSHSTGFRGSGMLQSQDWLWDYMEKITCPTLVIRAADSDMLLEETAQNMVAKLPHGSLAEVPHATHNIVGDNPEGFEKAVKKFLYS